MPQSKIHNAMAAQIRLLDKHYLDFSKKVNGRYTKKEISSAAAYTLFAHAEIENYLENWAFSLTERAEIRWKSGNQVSIALLSLLAFSEREMAPPKKVPDKDIWSAPVVKAIKTHKNIIESNNGIKEGDLCKLLVPLGFDVRNVDPILIAELNSLGTERGNHAHSSYKKQIGQIFDPFDRAQKVSKICTLLVDLDDQLRSYRARC